MAGWLALLLQLPQIGVWEWDLASGEVSVFGHWPRATGDGNDGRVPRTLEEWLGCVHDEDRADCERFIASIFDRPGVTGEAEFRLRYGDGSFVWQQCRGHLLPDPLGHAVRAVGVVREAPARGEAAGRLHQIERLEAVGQLTGGVAHDFNNLLTVIQGNVDLLADCVGEDSRCMPILEEIGTVVSRGSAVTRRLLSFARGEAHEAVAMDPDALLRGVLPLLEHSLGGAVELKTDLAARGWVVKVDMRAFENAILNLAINARDAMPAGGTLILGSRIAWLHAADVFAERDEKPGAYVQISVEDTGQGMASDVLARVFEPFFTTKAERGTGLGVPMVARFVRECGGFMRFESEVGRGTIVRLYLPRAASSAIRSENRSG